MNPTWLQAMDNIDRAVMTEQMMVDGPGLGFRF